MPPCSEDPLCADTPHFLIVTSSFVCKPNDRLAARTGQSLFLWLSLPIPRLLPARPWKSKHAPLSRAHSHP